MIRTRVGYTGGTSADPTYRNIGDHSEAIQIDYDPAKVSYGSLLEIFWDSHDPAAGSWSGQYRKAVFYHNEKQRLAAERSAPAIGGELTTRIEPFTKFYLAEGYHQKHDLRSHYAIISEFEEIYPDVEDLVASTAAARVNGYLGGYGTCEQLNAEIDGFGLSASSKRILLEVVCTGAARATCPAGGCI